MATLSAKERGQLGAQKRWGAQQQQPVQLSEGETPIYRITEICYCFDRLWDPTTQQKDDKGDPKPLYMEWTEKPAYYMVPANAATEEMYAKFPPAPWADVITQATKITAASA